jgi:hypothetical protein
MFKFSSIIEDIEDSRDAGTESSSLTIDRVIVMQNITINVVNITKGKLFKRLEASEFEFEFEGLFS